MNNILKSTLFIIMGIVLGLVSKWLDHLSFNDAIWWHQILEVTDLRNLLSALPIWMLFALTISLTANSAKQAALYVFLFFLGMNASYHWYSVQIIGFNPASYMMIWYTLTLISPILAYICWFTKADVILSFLIRYLISLVFMVLTFYCGWGYFDLSSISNLLIFIMVVKLIWTTRKDMLLVLGLSFATRILIGLFLFF